MMAPAAAGGPPPPPPPALPQQQQQRQGSWYGDPRSNGGGAHYGHHGAGGGFHHPSYSAPPPPAIGFHPNGNVPMHHPTQWRHHHHYRPPPHWTSPGAGGEVWGGGTHYGASGGGHRGVAGGSNNNNKQGGKKGKKKKKSNNRYENVQWWEEVGHVPDGTSWKNGQVVFPKYGAAPVGLGRGDGSSSGQAAHGSYAGGGSGGNNNVGRGGYTVRTAGGGGSFEYPPVAARCPPPPATAPSAPAQPSVPVVPNGETPRTAPPPPKPAHPLPLSTGATAAAATGALSNEEFPPLSRPATAATTTPAESSAPAMNPWSATAGRSAALLAAPQPQPRPRPRRDFGPVGGGVPPPPPPPAHTSSSSLIPSLPSTPYAENAGDAAAGGEGRRREEGGRGGGGGPQLTTTTNAGAKGNGEDLAAPPPTRPYLDRAASALDGALEAAAAAISASASERADKLSAGAAGREGVPVLLPEHHDDGDDGDCGALGRKRGRERWAVRLESVLRNSAAVAAEDDGQDDTSSLLRRDRDGVTVSAPWRLTPESWKTLLRRKNLDGTGGGGDGSLFTRSPAKNDGGVMEFRRAVASVEDYVPDGYEDFAAAGGDDGEEDHEQTEEEKGIGPVYLLEIADAEAEAEAEATAATLSNGRKEQDRPRRLGTATLEDYAVLSPSSNDRDSAAALWEEALTVNVMPSSRLVQLLEEHRDASYEEAMEAVVSGGWDDNDCIEEGEDEGEQTETSSPPHPSLSLPLAVGRGHGKDDGAPSSSLVAIVSLNHDADPHVWGALLESPLAAELVFRFSRRHARVADPFSAEASASRFYVGRGVRLTAASSDSIGGDGGGTVRHSDPGEGTAERGPEDCSAAAACEEEALEFLRKAMLNADRFVPEEKRRQWDEMPDAIMSVEPYRQLPPNLAWWMQLPGMRCSRYDRAYANCILHLEAEGLLPPLTTHVTRHGLLPLFGELARVHATIGHNVDFVRSEARHVTTTSEAAAVVPGEGGGGGTRRRLPCRRQMSPTTGAVVDTIDPDAMAVAATCRVTDENATRGGGGGGGSSDLKRQRKHLRAVSVGYLRHVGRALELERLRCVDDVRRHDLYSARWERIEVVTPLGWGQDTSGSTCGMCNRGLNNAHNVCAYHVFAKYKTDSGRWDSRRVGAPIAIESKEDLEVLSRVLAFLTPADRLVAKIVIPGVAENYPLVSMGDLVRFRFAASGLANEVVGEVVDVVVKTEVVSVLLPPPFRHGGGVVSYESLPYVQALLRTRTHMIDAGSFLQSPPTSNPYHAVAAAASSSSPQWQLPPALRPREIVSSSSRGGRKGRQEEEDDSYKHVGRFDLRLGFLGGRGFDIARSVLEESTADDVFARAGGADHAHHLRRVIAPTVDDCGRDKGRIERVRQFPDVGPGEWISPSLNDVQKKAVNDIVNVRHEHAPYIIFGPAGTGKTMVVCEAVHQVLRRDPSAKILVCAPSDAACDVLAKRILPFLPAAGQPKSKLLRVNWWCRKAASLPPSLLLSSPVSANNFFTIPRRQELEEASVVVCQCFVAGCLEYVSGLKMRNHFTHLFIDETSQAMECEALVPILKVSEKCSIILAGDHKQLGPTIRDPVAVELGLGMSIQERLMQLPLYQKHRALPFSVMTKLVDNYRSHDALLTVPSALFYGGQLNCRAPKEYSAPYADFGPDFGPAGFPMVLYDVSEGREDSPIVDSPSFYNLEECKAIVRIIKGLLKSKKVEGSEQPVTNTGDIAVITPFRSQVLMLRNKLRKNGLGSVNVGVVEDFQGQETSIVIISTVLTRPHRRWSRFAKGEGDDDGAEARLGFMHDPKRFNVAITRARAVCVVVGNARYLRESETYWTALVEHIERNEGVVSAEDNNNVAAAGGGPDSGDYSIQKLVQRVEELKLLGSGYEEDRYDLAFYYEDTPQWKVMLA